MKTILSYIEKDGEEYIYVDFESVYVRVNLNLFEEFNNIRLSEQPTSIPSSLIDVINIDGKDILCTYYLDDNWFTGYRKWQAKEDSMIGSESMSLTRGIIHDPFIKKDDRDKEGKEIGRKVNVEISPKNEEDFHPFEMTYAAVPNNDWYDLISYKDFQDIEMVKQKAEKVVYDAEREAIRKYKEENKYRRVENN